MLVAISNSKYSKALSTLLAFVIFFNNVIFPTKAMALTGGPSQIEFASFDPAGSSEMVNLFTGDFSYNIPLMDVDGYPINIAYHAAPSMDQEASWVGLGWNINAGAINRGMRGLPDDFDGDPIHRELNILDHKKWGVSMGYFSELAGLKMTVGQSYGVGITSSNYTGLGIETTAHVSLGPGRNSQGGLTGGLGVKIGSEDGLGLSLNAGVSGKLAKTGVKLGANVGCNINSREGLTSINGGLSITKRVGGTAIRIGSSASIPASSMGFMPKMIANMSSNAYSIDFKIGGNSCIYAMGGNISGFYSQNGIKDSEKNKDFSSYGYLFSQNGTDADLFDFTREKDGLVYPESPNMPIANSTYDFFSASAQGLNYAFRPYRNDIGVLRDNSTLDDSFGLGLGGEVMFGVGVNVGINVNVMYSDGTAGRWKDDNDFNDIAEFTKDRLSSVDYEAAYFKVAGEGTSDNINDAAFLSDIFNDEPVAVLLGKVSNTKYKAENILQNNYSQQSILQINPEPKHKKARATRNGLVSYLNAEEASKFALNKQIQNYPALTTAAFTPGNFDNIIVRTSVAGTEGLGEFVESHYQKIDRNDVFCAGKTHHLSEMSVTQANGSRYIYGIPLYNREQTDAMFNIDGAGLTNATIGQGGLAGYTADVDNSINNKQGQDHFMEKRKMGDYAHGFLLTSILSSDYVDRDGNGPSANDYGDYTKFNYSRVAGGTNNTYNWRIPFEVNKASFNQGLLADKKDNKGTYMYGRKDLWYTQSIETKNYIAFFVLNDPATDARLDAWPVNNENGSKAVSNPSRYIKEIRLYAKKDFIHNGLVDPTKGSIANAKPIKIVHFDYDYSLCREVPNNSKATKIVNSVDLNANHGKLTLKKIWFTYGNSQKGKLSPYVFDYNTENPEYNQASVDRWGAYKPNSGSHDNNLDFPYVKQNEIDLNKYAAAWSLSQISTPAGSKIQINYEADDYAYVQDKAAGQMFNVESCGSSANYSPGGYVLYDQNLKTNYNYLYVDLESSGAGGILASSSNPYNEFQSKFIKGLQKMYFKFKLDMTDGKDNYEFVPGYADIVSAGICPGGNQTYTAGGNTYFKYAYIQIAEYGINDKNSGSPLLNGIVKAGMQMGRMYLPQYMFPGSQPSAGNGDAIKGLLTSLSDIQYFLKGVNRALYSRNVARIFHNQASVVRLYNPNGSKKGGGHRVSQIKINDDWNSMSGEADSEYGQEYSYTTQRDGATISSGVACYEPLQGGDENSMRTPVDFEIAKTFAPNNEYFQEEPMGESFFPDAMVGYSKITVKNLPRTKVTAHATGKTEYEFFTSKDYPVITDRTALLKQRVKSNLLTSILKFGSVDKLYLSQGYLIKTNDMNGKLRSQKMYAENSSVPLSGITYHYKSKMGKKCLELDNVVDVIDKTNTIRQKTIGKTTDFYTDSRSAENNSYSGGIALNISSESCTIWVPLVFVWPSFAYDQRVFKSMGTTKLVQQYGLVDYVEAFENNSSVKTHNLLYDQISGDVLLTKTTNDFDAPVYNFTYPAYWGYQDMGAAFANAGIKIDVNGNVDGNGKITTTTFFRPGDEVGIFDNSTRTWVVEDKKNASGLYLVDIEGKRISVNVTAGNYLKILRSGYRNMQSAPMASLLSLKSPINPTSHKIDVTQATQIINSSAVEYSNEWQLLLGDRGPAPNICVCSITERGQAWINLITSLVDEGLIMNNELLLWDRPSGLYRPGFSPILNYISTHPQLHYLYWVNYNPFTPGVSPLVKSFSLEGRSYPEDLSKASSVCYAGRFTLTSALGVNWNEYTPINIKSKTPLVNLPNCPASNQIEFLSDFRHNLTGVILPAYYTFAQNNPTNCPIITCNTAPGTNQCGKIVGDPVNPYVENIRGNWRVKKSYSYLTDRTQANQGNLNMNGDISQDGTYTSFLPFWKYTTNNKWEPIYAYNGSLDKWVKNNEVDKINEYGNVLQARDVLNRSSASLYGYNHTLPIAAANNTYYNQLAFDGFEDYDFIRNECSPSLLGTVNSLNPSGYIEHFNYYIHNNKRTTDESHTGRYSIKVPANNPLAVSRKLTKPNPTGTADDDVPYLLKEKDNYGLFGPFYGYAQPQKFVLSVWAKEKVVTAANSTVPTLSYPNVGVSVSLNGANVTGTPKKSAIISGWQKLEYEFTVPINTPNSSGSLTYGNITVTLNSGSNDVYYDDIRIHPFNSSMKSMVYDPYNLRLMAELDDRNYATFYEYDEEGTLVRVKKETEKGIYTIKESRSGLKK